MWHQGVALAPLHHISFISRGCPDTVPLALNHFAQSLGGCQNQLGGPQSEYVDATCAAMWSGRARCDAGEKHAPLSAKKGSALRTAVSARAAMEE